MPRLFTALTLPEETCAALEKSCFGLKGARWIAPESYHITLTFIGDMDGSTAFELESALDQIDLGLAPQIVLHELGCFGVSQPKSLFVHADGGPAVERLKAASDGALRVVGRRQKRQRFVPHVTLARLKGIGAQGVAHFMEQAEPTRLTFYPQSMVLLSSLGSRGGGPYGVEREWTFS